jgi:hypothetical protein
MQFAENIQAKWQDDYCLIMTIPDSIRPQQPRREFKNCNGNFLNIHLTAWTWSLVTSICLVCLNTPWWQTEDDEVEAEVWKWLRQQTKDFSSVHFDALVKQWDKCIIVDGGYVDK